MKSYVSLDEMKRRLQVDATDVVDDAALRSMLEAVAEQVDGICGRTFQPFSGMVYYSGTAYQNYISVDDVLSVSSVATDTDGDRVYETTWVATDYDLEPYNAPQSRSAYSRLRMAPLGVQWLTTLPRGVQITGTFGYWSDTLAVGTLAADINASVTSLTLNAQNLVYAFQTILVGTEQLYVTNVAGASVTVERGVNGATAASHLTGAAVSVYRYPAPVVEASVLLALRLFKRREAPFGVTGAADFGALITVPKTDPDVAQLLAPYKRRGWFA